MKYYYLVASIPMLRFGTPPPFSVKQFVFQCTGILSEAALNELQHVLASDLDACTSRFAREYLGFERGLRFGISGIRAGRLGLDAAHYIDFERGYNTFVDRAIIDAFAKSDPQERAWVFDQTRWYMLEELSRHDPFGLPTVLASALKISLLERWSLIKYEIGRKQFNQQLEALLATAQPEAS